MVTAIIPAKDEEFHLRGCLETVVSQSYPNLEIVVVNDRSTDGTGRIAEEFARNDARVRVLNIESLPAGWTGKSHALEVARRDAQGEWLWFLDSDTRHAPDFGRGWFSRWRGLC
jgi:glycosyltransferase involved in cell wall biosynthesis